MIVKEVMSKNPVTIGPATKLRVLNELMKANDVRHVPVVKNGKMIGIVTEKDIRYAMIPEKIPGKKVPQGWNLDHLKVQDIMTDNTITIAQEAQVEEAARIIYGLKIHALPVMKNDKLVGIISVMDILGIFIEMMGMLKSSSRIDVLMKESQANFDKVSKIIHKNNGQIIGVGITPYPKDKKKSIYLFRLESCNVKPIAKDIKKEGFVVTSTIV
jgi:acetoin utilization protein AcuB